MKKIVFILFTLLTLKGISQAPFDVNFNRNATVSLIDSETDSLFTDKAEIRIYENASVASVEVKYYDYPDTSFIEVHNSSTSFSSVTDTPCSSDYCIYKLNPSVLIIDLGSHSATGRKHKVYIKINGTSGNGNLIKEVEL